MTLFGAASLIFASFAAGVGLLPFAVYTAVLVSTAVFCVGIGLLLFAFKLASSFVRDEADYIFTRLKEVHVESIEIDEVSNDVSIGDESKPILDQDKPTRHRVQFTV